MLVAEGTLVEVVLEGRLVELRQEWVRYDSEKELELRTSDGMGHLGI